MLTFFLLREEERKTFLILMLLRCVLVDIILASIITTRFLLLNPLFRLITKKNISFLKNLLFFIFNVLRFNEKQQQSERKIVGGSQLEEIHLKKLYFFHLACRLLIYIENTTFFGDTESALSNDSLPINQCHSSFKMCV